MDYDESDTEYYEEEEYHQQADDDDYDEEEEPDEDEFGMPIAKTSPPRRQWTSSPPAPKPRFIVLTKPSTIPPPSIVTEEIKRPVEAPPKPKTMPWKKLEPIVDRDPWKFLEPPPPPRRYHDHPFSSSSRSHRRDPPPPPQSLLLSSSRESREKSLLLPAAAAASRNENPRPRAPDNSNKLCKYGADCRMDREKRCSMVHSLKDWKPKICHLNARCPRKNDCGYYHTSIPIETYLSGLLKKNDAIYSKNASLYQKYLR